MFKTKCPKCEAPRTYQKTVKTQYEHFIEITYQCGAKAKEAGLVGEPGRFKWIRECGFKIRNDFY